MTRSRTKQQASYNQIYASEKSQASFDSYFNDYCALLTQHTAKFFVSTAFELHNSLSAIRLTEIGDNFSAIRPEKRRLFASCLMDYFTFFA